MAELFVQCGERDKGVKGQKDCAFLLCFCWVFFPSCLGFLESIRPPCIRTSLHMVILLATCYQPFWFMSAPQIQSFNSNKNIY